ncbi:helix-turn-helix domain-containing protein [Pedobacter zeae]|uniref:AraC-like DNA-binding protein n=1 Tax=Pedobacter zeae TaxID=1737356 RepID=A0A7W6K898_9SPHI|nr:helix-turn-helix domain-containing protein [Pedobacter zeae]MBB4106932.1 AraC-like DNA-binding protein [Pedobacter zeae]GGH04672.1 transcriptional regulator [Pedobacter zeae]
MKLHYIDPVSTGELHLNLHEPDFDRLFFKRDHKDKFLTIAWNDGPAQIVTIDGIQYTLTSQTVLPLMVNQTFTFEHPEQVIAWQYNRNFYCIVDHDKEVSCVGFLFYGSAEIMFIALDEKQQRKLNLLLQVFIEEFDDKDTIQRDMLQMLLKRLIIIVTRLAKKQYLNNESLTEDKLDILRKFNLLVENNYRKQHTVQFYADRLNKSPKTLANYFAIYNDKSPLTVIRDRLLLEAKRLLMYTDKSAKEIAYDLGYEDAAYFSNFFKKQIGIAPSDFRNAKSKSTFQER